MPPEIKPARLVSELPVLPLEEVVLFPGETVTITLRNAPSLEAVTSAVTNRSPIIIVTQKNPDVEEPTASDLYRVGVVARWTLVQRHDTGYEVSFHGLARVRLKKLIPEASHLWARVALMDEPRPRDAQSMLNALNRRLYEYLRTLPKLEPSLGRLLTTTDPRRLADLIAANIKASVPEQQAILEEIDVRPRIDRVHKLIDRAWHEQAPVPR